MNALEAICKPGFIYPFTIMCRQLLWLESIPFGLSVFRLFSLIRDLRLLQWFNFHFLHSVLILTVRLIESIKLLHIVLRALHPGVTADAYLSRITPNGRGSSKAIYCISSCRSMPTFAFYHILYSLHFRKSLRNSFPRFLGVQRTYQVLHLSL